MSRFPFTYCADFIRSVGPHDGLSPVLSRANAAVIKAELALAIGMDETEFAQRVARYYMAREGIVEEGGDA